MKKLDAINFEQKIGFNRIREQVRTECTTAGGAEKVLAQGFCADARKLAKRLDQTEQMRTVLVMESGFKSDEFVDLTSVVTKAKIEGAFLDISESIILCRGLEAVEEVVRYINSRDEGAYPALRELTKGVETLPHITQAIRSIIDERLGEVKDTASAELVQIRRSIREHEGQAQKRLNAVLQAAKSSGVVESDASISMRDGRAVIPVSSANKRKLQGFIHDESATGKTVYIEPVEVVEINNRLRELEYAQRREVVRILTEFTASLQPDLGAVELSGDFLTTIDMIRAKARWASKNSAGRPIISNEGRLLLRSARHPLLAQTLKREHKELIPLDMELDKGQRLLVISGPNAGGKSVCLKTVGLLQYMFQCGFLITALENSELPLFESLFIDIGDEQSIDNDLSTYSSHLFNMKNMLSGASDRSLVLIDEFGSGTEPNIGGAIAESILERFVERGAYGVITTHYANIKYFASNTQGVRNGAMMFDVQNIRPLFKLEMGKPGSSFAIEIARKIGLPEQIIKSASEKVGSDQINLERQLREIARDKRYWEQKRDRIRLTDRRVEELEQDYSSQLSRIKAERQQIIKEAKAEAKRLVEEANRSIENTIRTIKEAQADKELTRLARKELDDFREQISTDDKEKSARVEREMERIEARRKRREERKVQKAEQGVVEVVKPKEITIEVGTKVRIKGQDTVGEVREINGKKLKVAFGQILTNTKLESVEAISNSEYKRATRPTQARTVVSVDISSRKLNFKDNIDVRGMRAAEALELVQDFIDDALMVGVSTVTILHGKGTGALKEEIRRYLRTVTEVSTARDEAEQLGGAGITVVTFRE